MKKRTRVIVISVIAPIIVLFLAMYLYMTYRINNYIEASKPKITEDISESESELLQDEFGISLPPEEKITAFSISTEEIIIRIEGVEDLPTFLTDSIHLELTADEMQAMIDDVNYGFEDDSSPKKDMYGENNNAFHLFNYDYQADPISHSLSTAFFHLDGNLVIEMKKSYITVENQQALRDMVNN